MWPVDLGREKADAAFNIPFARFSSAFSFFSRRISSAADDDGATEAATVGALRTHCRTVSADPTPSRSAALPIAAHSVEPCSTNSATNVTASRFNSAEYRFDPATTGFILP